MKINVYHGLALALVLTACSTSPVPVAENYQQSTQKKAVAAQHWNFIANDVVEQTKISLAKQNYLSGKPLYVSSASNTQFDQAFRNYMISSLVNADLPVSTKKEGAVEIKYETQVIQHAVPFDPRTKGYQPGSATLAVSGLWVLRDALNHWSTGNAVVASVGAAAAYDIYKAYESQRTAPTNTELLITTSIVNSANDQYVMRKTDAYYIERAESSLFKPSVFKEWKVVGQ